MSVTPANPAISERGRSRSLPDPLVPGRSGAGRAKAMLTSRVGSVIAVVIALLWTVPIIGMLLSSVRPESEIRTSGWWTFFTNPTFTMENYQEVLFGRASSGALSNFFVNSVVITVPATIIPLVVATMAAYAFSVLQWKGRDTVFIAVFALQIVPLQMALIPLLRIFSGSAIGEQFPYLAVWFAHACFAMPLATFLLHNFMSEIPRELIEAARVDGAGHVTVFLRVMLPLLVPAIASFAIFQFLWVWNDLLVGLTFTGGNNAVQPLTARLAEMAGSRGQDWHLLTAGAFVSIIVPIVVFLALQKYFVRGLLAGSVKG
ncbi:carbohydrate ABC transporter membrane protein 2, CUT1 family [Georgenia satyanarayanai]|uniref:Carbohydrate ABC transporter membrane protein 2, CUT1 family n=1 Tax=Georgenia satyanarayanai TaxID=860221 RepID=A0A2Y9ALU0_9MICO|nr:carbohydrate ABC transporter permease [Georgenia satyanarayanai]PYF97847.1 carbohydrate ABC transporter membrane protein 2 (CUT1 family) [Georgenia satyanarayanai]SSA45421.1 carbohydrate ABC transporter membrane protein 2, CUT1 family [Georgenia satyanarayanai]